MFTAMISGNVVEDAQIRSTNKDGQNVLSFRVANNERDYKDPNTGEWVKKPRFVQVQKFFKADSKVGNLTKGLVKGAVVTVTGEPKAQAYTDKNNALQASLVIEMVEIDFHHVPKSE